MTSQGRSHAFESEGAQSPKAILGPFCLKKWEGLSLLLLLYGQKSGGPRPPGPLILTTALYRLKLNEQQITVVHFNPQSLLIPKM